MSDKPLFCSYCGREDFDCKCPLDGLGDRCEFTGQRECNCKHCEEPAE